jgi:hypothetical protein
VRWAGSEIIVDEPQAKLEGNAGGRATASAERKLQAACRQGTCQEIDRSAGRRTREAQGNGSDKSGVHSAAARSSPTVGQGNHEDKQTD